MARLANGRIVLWQGGGLWVLRVPALPQAKKRTDFHAHHAIQITLALDGDFELHLTDRALRGPAVVIAADVSHAFEPKGLIALLFVDPESAAGRSLAGTLLAGRPAADLPPVQAQPLRAAIGELAAAPAAGDAAWEDVGRALTRQLVGGAATNRADARIEASLAFAGAHLDDRISIADLARLTGLSADRMSHLFVEQTGLPFRTYLLWLRMTRALDAYAHGASLTTAAHDAGFSDSAHFSRTFRRMFGVAAAELQLA